jgi:hypothetical protein
VATPSLRPLSVGEILDAGIKVCTRHWKALALCVVVPVLPLAILQVLLIASVDPEALELLPETEESSLSSDEIGAEFWVTSGISAVLAIVLFIVVNTACFKAVADGWLGATPTAGRSLRFGLKSAPRIMLLSLVWFPALVLGFVACLVPGIWLFVIWTLAVPALLFERVGPFKALGRSYGLVQNRFWATFLLLLVSLALVGILGGIVAVIPSVFSEVLAPENRLAASVANVVGTTIGNVITYPYSAAVVAILYFDQRVRKEGFDVQMLAEGLGQPFDPDAPLPAPLQPGPYTAPPPQAWQPQGQYGGGWNAPSHEAAPPRWNPPPDNRPPEESPWMRPSAGGPSTPPPSWADPGGSLPDEPLWGSRSDAGASAPDESRWARPSEPGAPDAGAPDASPGGSGGPPPGGPGASLASGSPLADEPAPTEPLPPTPPAGDAQTSPEAPAGDDSADDAEWESRWGKSSPFGESPWEDKPSDEKDKKDSDRADWQPPEEPRGPGGL